MKKKDGLQECEEAFDRLVNGSPRVAAHVGIIAQKITSGVVSVEAGFDRGYLKSARLKHQSLVARINAFRESGGRDENNYEIAKVKGQLHRAGLKASNLEGELEMALRQRQAVIEQNVQLHERVRRLELKVAELQPRLRIIDE